MRRALIELYAALVLGRPRSTLAVCAVLVLGLGAFAFDLRVDVSADSLVLENDADLDYYRAVSARYGSDDYVIVTYSPQAELFSPPVLATAGCQLMS